ncbi:MAG: TIGR01210 family protein [Microgenomates bacterium 39_6]|nr:MAG: TIGR01210 family protein [Microgenomates bacterium 39_6]
MEDKIRLLRKEAGPRSFDPNKVAEIEISESYFNRKTVKRIMVVLRATGCFQYRMKQGCAMCGHFDATSEKPVKAEEYLAQWQSVLDGSAIEGPSSRKFNLNDYKILCLYNMGSFLNINEVSEKAITEIFKSIAQLKGIQKTIIESRAEYVRPWILEKIRRVNKGLVEVGVGLESSDFFVRELCHHKNMPSLKVFKDAVKNLHKFGFHVLAYVNQKPPFLTEKEAIDDTIKTSIFAYDCGCDAVSIEPTSLQEHTLTDYLYNLGMYRVPWLWSVREVVRGIYKHFRKTEGLDLRVGGYFDEEVLSGSQGVAAGKARNEIFPHATAGNCQLCTADFIQAIKNFNKTNNPKFLETLKECPYCYHLWEDAIKIKDSRMISQRIIDTLS